jgi:hypothetical protein
MVRDTRQYVCWRAGQAHPFESAWSLFNKFCRWNSARYAEVWCLFSVNTQPCPSKSRFVLSNPTWINRHKFEALLRLTPENASSAFIEEYLGNSSASALLSSNTYVRFCPQCAARGFHSPLHDLLFIQTCPIHQVPLFSKCPKCSERIDHALPRIANHDPYGCRCGHLLWTTDLSPPFGDDEVKRLRITADWINRVRPTILANLPVFCRSGDPVRWREPHVASLGKYLATIDPSLAPPSFILSSDGQLPRSTLLTSGSGDEQESSPKSEHLIAIYKAIARRITRVVRRKIAAVHRPGPRLCTKTRTAIDREPTNIALYSWRMFWEGLGRLESKALFTRTSKDRWRQQVLDRASRMFAGAPESDADRWSQWTDSHLFGAACLGTLAECIKRSGEVESTEHAGELASSLTCEFVPFCLSTRCPPAGTKQALHLLLPEEFSILRTFLA